MKRFFHLNTTAGELAENLGRYPADAPISFLGGSEALVPALYVHPLKELPTSITLLATAQRSE